MAAINLKDAVDLIDVVIAAVCILGGFLAALVRGGIIKNKKMIAEIEKYNILLDEGYQGWNALRHVRLSAEDVIKAKQVDRIATKFDLAMKFAPDRDSVKPVRSAGVTAPKSTSKRVSSKSNTKTRGDDKNG